MRNISNIVLAAMLGIATEAALIVISVISVFAGGFGPCGPTGDVPGLVSIIHQPGFWLAGLLLEERDFLYFPLAMVITTTLLSILAFVVLKFGIGRN